MFRAHFKSTLGVFRTVQLSSVKHQFVTGGLEETDQGAIHFSKAQSPPFLWDPFSPPQSPEKQEAEIKKESKRPKIHDQSRNQLQPHHSASDSTVNLLDAVVKSIEGAASD